VYLTFYCDFWHWLIQIIYKMRTKFSGILTLLLAFAVQLTFAQEKSISGLVSDDAGLPLPGVNIVVKGTSNGTQSDFDGNYSIQVNVGQALVYSYVGFKTTEKSVTAATSTISFQMEVDAAVLSEVVVTGYGIPREKKALGYAVVTLGAEEVENKPESDLVRTLNGKVAGVQIVGTSGATGSGTNFIIRSKSSINGSNQPLFIVDGVPFDGGSNLQTGFAGGNSVTSSRFLDLDPNNIESISILKGLNAAVLYGQQGRNGVVLITTKNGSTKNQNKKFEVVLSQSVYITEISNLADYQNTYGQGSNQASNPGFVGNWGSRLGTGEMVDHPYAAQSDIFPQYEDLEVPYVAAPNNVKDFFRTGLGHSTSVNVSGSPGDGGSRYNMNFGYTTEDGYIPNNGLTRYNIGMGGSAKLSNKFSFDGTANFSSLRVNTPPIAANNAAGSLSIFTRLLFIPRNIDLENLEFENPNDRSSVYYRGDQENPYWLLNYAGTEQNTNRFFGNLATSYEVSDNILISYRFGLDTYTEQQEFRVALGAVTAPYDTGYLRTTSGTNFIYDHNLNFSFSNYELADDFNFNAQVGFNAKRETYEQFGVTSTGQVVFGFFNHRNFVNQTDNDPVTGSLNFRNEQNVMGAYGQAEFDYGNYLFLTLSGRNDWASTVESENRSLFYPGVALSFVPTSLDAISTSGALNFMKLRAGYGTSARFPSPYGTRAVLSTVSNSFVDTGGNSTTTNSLPTTRANLNLKPELQKEFELGAEVQMFDRRLSLDLTVYKRIIEDQIVFRPLNPSTGFRFINDNIAESEIQGIEIGFDVIPLQTENFTWSIRSNFTAYENEVTDLGGVPPFAFAGFSNLGNFAEEGQPLGVIKGSYATSYDPGNVVPPTIDPITGEITDPGNPLGLGVEGVLLINPNDGKIIDSGALSLVDEIIGDPNPDWNLTVINGFSYKGLTLSAQIEYQHGGDIYSQTASQYYRRGVTTVNEDNREGSYIIPGLLANPNTGELLLDESGNTIENTIQIGVNDVYFINLVDPSGQGIYDASHLRLREVALVYDLSEKTLERTPFGNVSFTLSGQNLYVRTYNIPQAFNIDPEALSTGVGNGSGLEFQTGPSSKRFALAIKATF
jgi:TonB-linked SusC/RagA family outer membrane protein